VRTAEEFAEGHAPNALNVPIVFGAAHGSDATPTPNTNFLSQVQALVHDKDVPLVCHCLHGRRGAMAAEQLAAGGFKDVVNVQGGLTALQQAGLPVEK
jgi:phage shock protein E